jgi:hypothetical protein
MALNLIENVAAAAAAAPQATAEGSGRKRTWSASNREDQGSDNANRHWQSGGSSGGNHGRHWRCEAVTAATGAPAPAGGPLAVAANGNHGAAEVATSTRAVETLPVGRRRQMLRRKRRLPPLRCRHMATAAKVYNASFAKIKMHVVSLKKMHSTKYQ